MVCEGHFIKQAKIYYENQSIRSASNKSMISDSQRK
jgi:hypothetical protein